MVRLRISATGGAAGSGGEWELCERGVIGAEVTTLE